MDRSSLVHCVFGKLVLTDAARFLNVILTGEQSSGTIGATANVEVKLA
jgi:hypothetical protein